MIMRVSAGARPWVVQTYARELESASWTSGMTLLVDTAAVRFVAVPPRSGALPRWTEVVLTVDTARVVLSGLLRTVNS
jgi:hypothetical protein